MAYNVSLEDSSPLISYSPAGAWTDTPQGDFSSSSYSGSSFHTTSTPGASLSFSFNGTGIWLYGARRSEYGSYTISVDGVEMMQENANSPDSEFQQSLGGVASLQMGSHEVTLTNTGSMVDLDYVVFEADGPEATTVATFDDSDVHITYDSQWALGNHPGFYNSTIHYTQSADASLGFSFTGDSIAIYGTVAQSMGNYSVNLDGVEKTYNAGGAGSSQVLHATTLLYYANNIGSQSHNVVLTANPSGLGDAAFFELDSVSVASSDGGSVGTLGYPSDITTTSVSPATPTVLSDSQPRAASDSNQFNTNKGVIAGAAAAAAICALGIIFLGIFLWKRRRSDPPSYMDVEEKDLPNVATSAFSPITPGIPIQDVEKQARFVREPITPAYREFSAYDSYYEAKSDRSTFYEDHSTYGSINPSTRTTVIPNHGHSDSVSSDATLCTTDTAPLNLNKHKRNPSDSSVESWNSWGNDSRSSYASTMSTSSTLSDASRRILIDNMPMPPQFKTPLVPARTAHPTRPSRKRDTIPIPF